MSLPLRRRFARRQDLGLGATDFARLARLDSPQRIQAFLNAIPINHEPGGETVYSVRGVLRHRRAHCIEAAFVAACALWIHGEPPLVMHLDCELGDYPHVVALFGRKGAWGAISKSNGVALRFRDPVFRSLRELALSYFHEYSDKRGRRTLRSYTSAFDLRRLDVSEWVCNDDNCWVAHDRLAELRHHPLVDERDVERLSRRDTFERRIARAVQYPDPKTRASRGSARSGRGAHFHVISQKRTCSSG
jgi:hypothetical protein